MRMADVADTELLFRLIQSIPSPKSRVVQAMDGASGKKVFQIIATTKTMDEHAEVAIKGAIGARNARLEKEEVLGEKVVTSLNTRSIQKSIKDKNESE